MKTLYDLPKDLLVKIIGMGLYKEYYILVCEGKYSLNKEKDNKDIVRLYSSKENLYKGYIELNKLYYGEDYGYARDYCIRQIEDGYWFGMTEEVKADLIKYLREEEYQGIFTIDDMRELDDNFRIYVGEFVH